ncbi:NAD-dependent epimerase/dehydratase family protein [Sulfurimonas sp. SWIR-19]|uniref:NAD-dependent epimerase/dehydratase family protein n=1 Tax=Sulfurimonas sp. SWIR-19 TaxID=2878390 RepID=UPI001CF5061E|nr:NAD-dependent epimerase/dehydratase family protein [Sulfurimonas sp. SWIR-19]UCN01139.1 NAD-dependent epimerase/dehydratase family protein [Sulfurimonas sp. SWIR-19]
MKKLLLTGASGFVGHYFINKYAKKYDIQTFSFLQDSFDGLHVKDVDVVVHLSALVHQMGGASKEEYEKINVTQTLDLAKKAKASGVKQFVFMSSVKVYGEESDVCYTEHSTCNPQDEYGKSKLKAEQELQKLEDDSFLVSIIRTPIVYGYGVKANLKNLVNLVHKVPVLPFGGIKNRRSMIYIGNLCFFIDAVIERQKSGIFLVSDDEPLSTTGLIELIAANLGKKVYLVKVPFFETLLKFVKPSFHKRLYGSLEVDNKDTLRRIFGEAKASLPYSVEEGIGLMIHGEKEEV